MADTQRPQSAVERIQQRVQEKAARRAAARAAEDRSTDPLPRNGATTSTVVDTERREAERPAPEVPSEA